MNNRALKVLEFDKVRQRVREYAACSLGKGLLEDLHPYADMEAATRELQAVDEALRFRFRLGSLPFGGITDIRLNLSKAAKGGSLGPHELNAICHFIAGGRQVRQMILASLTDLEIPQLQLRAETLFDARQTELEIRHAISEDAVVLDHASSELRKIRSAKQAVESRIRSQLDQMLRSHSKYLQDPVIAMRGASYCLPIRVEYKNQVPGLIHDYSSSGATVFIEPQSVVDATQRVRELVVEEEREIERILTRLSGVVAEVAEELRDNATHLGQLDAWFAKAEYAKVERCEQPQLRADGYWNLKGARHPLIDKSVAVPITVTLGQPFRMLIITGPNTGGKTVTLKTIGLLTLMAMSGMFIPTEQASEVGWSDEIFADIGDEQSIEQSLSTFSSHMKNIVEMLDALTKESLVLLDELGAGTDPTEGASLAVAILDYMKNWGCKVVATTHYAELKDYAFREDAAMNASVEFDVQTLRPTYRLQVGVPGRSNAFAIATRLGLSDHIVANAKSLVKQDDLRIEDLIAQMEEARKEADIAHNEAIRERDAVRHLRESLAAEIQARNEELHEIRSKALLEAQDIVYKAQQEATRVIQELRRHHQGGPVKDHELVALRKSLEMVLPDENPGMKNPGRQASAIPVGSIVKVKSLGQKGEVLEAADDGEYVVQLGLLRTKVAIADLELMQVSEREKPVSTVKRSAPKAIPLQLDVRGDIVEDAIVKIDKYLDDAFLNGFAKVLVIHGKGTGALRSGIRQYLRKHPRVAAWTPGGPSEGGDGATVIDIK